MMHIRSFLQRMLLLLSLITPSSAIVIDDSQWNTRALQLSSGWNMLRPDQTEAIDQFQVDLMKPLLPKFYNRSISWTSQKSANLTLRFTGNSIAVMSARGPAGSSCTLVLDGKKLPDACSTRAVQFIVNQTLFHYEGLPSGDEHNLTIINSGEGFMYFDYANVTNTPPDAIFRVPSSQAPLPTSASGSPPVSSPSTEAAAGVTKAVTPSLTPQPAAITPELLSPSYAFHWNSRVYFVVLFATTMALIILGLLIKHRHTEAKNRKPLAARSFMGAGAAGKRGTIRSRLNKLNGIRKSKISVPMKDVESLPGHVRMHSEQGSDKPGLWIWTSRDHLQSKAPTNILSSDEGHKPSKQMTLGEALKQDRMYPPPQ